MSSYRLRLSMAAAAGLLASLFVGAAMPAAAADAPAQLTLSVTPSPIATIDLTRPHALSITVACATTIGTLTVTMTEPDGTTITLQPGVPVPTTSKGFDVSVTPAAHGDYVIAASSTGCGDAAPFTVTATGPDIVTDMVTTPGQLSAAAFAATGVTFTGTGFHAGAVLAVTSTVPGFVPTTVTTDAGGGFGFVQTGSSNIPDGYYSTSFSGDQDGVSLGTYLVGIAPPTVSDPHLTLSTHRLTLSQYLSTGVTASATGYAPGDLVIAQDVAPSGTQYLRGNGGPDPSGAFVATVTGAANALSDRLGVHTVTFTSFLGPVASDIFEVVPDPIAVLTASPDPVEQGDPIRFSATGLSAGASYILVPDHPLAGGGLLILSADGSGDATITGTVPADYALGRHAATLFVIGTSAGAPPTVDFTVVVPVPVLSIDPTTVPTAGGPASADTPPAAAAPGLAQTGADPAPAAAAAAALVFLGVAVSWRAAWRRRRSS